MTLNELAWCDVHGGCWSYKCNACWERSRLYEKELKEKEEEEAKK